MKKIYSMVIAMITLSTTLFSQNVNVSGALVGNGTYATLGAAFTAINGGAQTGATISVDVVNNTTELSAAVLNQSAGPWTSLTISPSGGASRTISGGIAGHMIDLNGADNVTIDGLNSGGNFLFIDNTNGGSSTSTIRFTNDASNNTITRTNINGSAGAILGTGFGVIYFGTGATTGNDNNTISNCNITSSSGGTPLNAIYSFGSSTAIDNSNNTITVCNISNFFNSVNSSTGINVNSGSSTWTITNNSFYQTATRTSTAASNIPTVVNILTGNGYTISNNFIGGTTPGGGGTPWTFNGAFTNRFIGINITSSVGAASSVQNNNIANLIFSTTSGTSTSNGVWCGISATGAGTINIGNVTGNTIGATTGTGSITTTASTTAALTVGINVTCTGTTTMSNNNIGSITANGSAATVSASITGIQVTAGTPIITNNTIGSTITANSINSPTVATTGSQLINGINVSTVTVPTTITGNTVSNLNQNGTTTGASCRGIIYSGTGLATISNNIVNNISGASANTTVAGGATAVQGICYTGTSPLGATVSFNEVYTIRTTNAGAVATTALGIGYSNPTSGRIFKNKIYDIRNASTMAIVTTPPIACGIMLRAAPDFMEVSNNMISLGNAQTTNTEFIGIWNSLNTIATIRAYFNSVNIEGSAAAGALPSFAFLRGDNTATSALVSPVAILNNIFNNSRTGGTGNHYAIGNNYGNGASAAGGWGAGASNYNILNSASASTVGYWNTAQTFAGWKTASAGDALSYTATALPFVNTALGNLHLNFGVTPTSVESGGVAISGLTDDIDNDVRPGPVGSVNGGGVFPDLGADEIDAVPIDIAPPVISYTSLTFTCATGDRIFTGTIQDISGVPTSGALQPRVYYRKNAGTWFSSQGTLSSGTSKNGVWSFTIIAADMGGLAIADVVQYYVIAQDVATPTSFISSNPAAGLVASDVNTVTTAPTTPNSYTIASTLSGTYAVGVGQTYTTLTAAVNAYNTSCLSGPVVFQLMDVNYSGSETFPISVNFNSFASSVNTLTIRPASGVTSSIIGSANGPLITLNGANYVTIDGSNSGGSDRSLTIENTSVTTPNVVLIGSLGTTTVTNNTLKNCVIRNGVNTSSAVVISDATTIGSTGYFNNITIQNNDIQKAYIGVYATGGTTPQNGSNLTYTQNSVNTSGVNAIRNVGLYMQGVNGATVSNNTVGNFSNIDGENDVAIWLATGTGNTTVSNNTVTNLGMTLTTAFAPFGIRESSGLSTSGNIIISNSVSNISTSGSTQSFGIDNGGGGTIIEKNNVQGILNNSTGTFGSYGINTNAGNNVVIKNNFVSNVSHNMTGGGAFSTTFGVFGIRLGAGTGHQVYHNSVNLYGPLSGTATTSLLSAAFAIVSTASTGCDVRNNIFANNITGGTTSIAQVAVYLPSGGTSAMNLTMNNNLYYFGTDVARNGVGQAGTTAGTNFYTTLAAMTAYSSTLSVAGTNDNASQAFTTAVPFISATDLHINSANCALDNKGTPIASIISDIDNQTRDAIVPDMGADEFDALSNTLYNTVGTTISETRTLSGSTVIFKSPICERFAALLPNGGSPVTGSVTARVYKYSTVQTYNAEPYVQRVIDITPANTPATKTGRVTLYYTQQEFDDFNLASGPWPDLPTGSADATGIANLRITKYAGTPNTTPSSPNQYSAGTAVYIDPPNGDIVWNATDNRWEVTIDVTGFSGFYIHTNSQYALPISINYLNGKKQGTSHLLDWKVTCNTSPKATLILERSASSTTGFSAINTTVASAARCAQPFDYLDASPLLGMNYYRLKIIDVDGKVTYSNTIAILNAVKGFNIVNIAPNPVTSNGQFKLNVATAKADKMDVVIIDMQGRIVERKTVATIAGFNSINMNVVNLAAGTYTIKCTIADDKTNIIRFVKQ